MSLTGEQRKAWNEQGVLHLPGIFNAEPLDTWARELAAWPETPGKWMKYFEAAVDGRDDRMLCRVECFSDYHEGWRSIIQHPKMMAILAILFGEDAILFKEKLNYKLPGGNGFTPHQDAPAFQAFGQAFHITVMVSVDATTVENGCLYMAVGEHRNGLFAMTPGQTLDEDAVARLEWTPFETQPGDVVIFGSMIPHYSTPNRSHQARRTAYLTYNAGSLGSRRDEYFQNKRAVFPPEVERVPGRDYSETGRYNIGNPIR